METNVREILKLIHENHSVLGDLEICIRNMCAISEANENSLCFCKYKDEKALEMIKNSKARVIICSEDLELPKDNNWGKTIIQVANPRLTYSRLLAKFHSYRIEPGYHPTAVIDERAKMGNNVYVGPHSYVGDCEIGDDTVIDGNVYIYTGSRIGKGVIIHAGVVIGADAGAFTRNEKGEFERFSQISGVIIEDNVEVGANSVICRGSLSNTIIGKGTKLDISIAVTHGVRIGKHCFIASGTTICGSVKIGDQTWIGPKVCIREGITIGNRVVVGAGSVVHKDIADNLIVTGSPARPIPPNVGGNKVY